MSESPLEMMADHLTLRHLRRSLMRDLSDKIKGVSWVYDRMEEGALERIADLTCDFHRINPNFINKTARYAIGYPKEETNARMVGIYFIDIDFRNAIQHSRDPENPEGLVGRIVWD